MAWRGLALRALEYCLVKRGRGMRFALRVAAVAAAMTASQMSLGVAADMAVKAAPARAAPAWTITFNSQWQYVSWTGSRGWPNSLPFSGRGSEFYNPFGVEVAGSGVPKWDFDFVMRGRFV